MPLIRHIIATSVCRDPSKPRRHSWQAQCSLLGRFFCGRRHIQYPLARWGPSKPRQSGVPVAGDARPGRRNPTDTSAGVDMWRPYLREPHWGDAYRSGGQDNVTQPLDRLGNRVRCEALPDVCAPRSTVRHPRCSTHGTRMEVPAVTRGWCSAESLQLDALSCLCCRRRIESARSNSGRAGTYIYVHNATHGCNNSFSSSPQRPCDRCWPNCNLGKAAVLISLQKSLAHYGTL